MENTNDIAGLDTRIEELISAAVMAGAYRHAARECSRREVGWLVEAASKHSRTVERLAGEVGRAAALARPAASHMDFRDTRQP